MLRIFFQMIDFFQLMIFKLIKTLSLAIKNGGISKINLNEQQIFIYQIPYLKIVMRLLHLDDGSLAGVNKKHLFILKDDIFYFM